MVVLASIQHARKSAKDSTTSKRNICEKLRCNKIQEWMSELLHALMTLAYIMMKGQFYAKWKTIIQHSRLVSGEITGG